MTITTEWVHAEIDSMLAACDALDAKIQSGVAHYDGVVRDAEAKLADVEAQRVWERSRMQSIVDGRGDPGFQRS